MEKKKQKKKQFVKLSNDTKAIISTMIEIERVNAKLRCDLEKSRIKTYCDIAKIQSNSAFARAALLFGWIGFVGFIIADMWINAIVASIGFSILAIIIALDLKPKKKRKK